MDHEQVFVSDGDALPADYYDSLQSFQKQTDDLKRKREADEKARKSRTEESLMKSFVADSGIRYVWDEDEDDWVEADEYESEEEAKPQGGGCGSGDEEGPGKRVKIGMDRNSEEPEKTKRVRKNKNKKKKPVNNWVYITGLPVDVTEEELRSHFSKVGMLAINPYDQTKKVKIYRDSETGLCKGDASVCYASTESVQMALDILHEGYIRSGYQLAVSRAEFSVPSGANSNAAGSNNISAGAGKKPALTKAQITVANNAMKQALSWNDEGDLGLNKAKALKIVVIQGMFHPRDFRSTRSEGDELEENGEADAPDSVENALMRELEEDVVEECTEKCGAIDKITIFRHHPKGIIIVKFSTAYAAEECIRLMDGRWYNKSQLRSYYWDGVTNYSVTSALLSEEQKLQEQKRLDDFGSWLEEDQGELPEALRPVVEK